MLRHGNTLTPSSGAFNVDAVLQHGSSRFQNNGNSLTNETFKTNNMKEIIVLKDLNKLLKCAEMIGYEMRIIKNKNLT